MGRINMDDLFKPPKSPHRVPLLRSRGRGRNAQLLQHAVHVQFEP